MTDGRVIGPAKDLNRVRGSKPGRVQVEQDGTMLRFVAQDGTQVALTVSDPVQLIGELVVAVQGARERTAFTR